MAVMNSNKILFEKYIHYEYLLETTIWTQKNLCPFELLFSVRFMWVVHRYI